MSQGIYAILMKEFRAKDFQSAMDHLYEAALSPELWPAALETLADVSGGVGGVLLHDPNGREGWNVVSPELEDCTSEFFAKGWGPHNYRTTLGTALTKAGDAFITEKMLLEPRLLDRQPIQADLFRKYGLRSFVGFDLAEGVLGSIELGNRDFADWELATLKAAFPHFRRVGELATARGMAAANGILNGLSLVRQPAALLDRQGRLMLANEIAEPLIESAFHVLAGRLVPRHGATRAPFEAIVARSTLPPNPTGEAPVDPLLIPREAMGPVLVRVAPIVGRARDLFEQAKALMTFADLGRGLEINEAVLRQSYGLTTAEARLARCIAEGEDLASAGARLGIGKETLRSHLKAIFGKTGTHRQTELSMLVNRYATTF